MNGQNFQAKLLVVIVLLLAGVVGFLGNISSTLDLMYDERTMRVTEVVNNNENKYDVASYGVVVLPDSGLTKGDRRW